MLSLLVYIENEKNKAMIKTNEHPSDAYIYINKKFERYVHLERKNIGNKSKHNRYCLLDMKN